MIEKDIALIVKVLSSTKGNTNYNDLAWEFADELLDEDPFFDHDRFIRETTSLVSCACKP